MTRVFDLPGGVKLTVEGASDEAVADFCTRYLPPISLLMRGYTEQEVDAIVNAPAATDGTLVASVIPAVPDPNDRA